MQLCTVLIPSCSHKYCIRSSLGECVRGLLSGCVSVGLATLVIVANSIGGKKIISLSSLVTFWVLVEAKQMVAIIFLK